MSYMKENPVRATMAKAITAIAKRHTYHHESEKDLTGRAVPGEDPDLRISRIRQQRDKLLAALAELVALKNLKDRAEAAETSAERDYCGREYQQRKPAAWKAAREAMAGVIGPWCCKKGQQQAKQVCDECAEINDWYQSCLGVSPTNHEDLVAFNKEMTALADAIAGIPPGACAQQMAKNETQADLSITGGTQTIAFHADDSEGGAA